MKSAAKTAAIVENPTTVPVVELDVNLSQNDHSLSTSIIFTQ